MTELKFKKSQLDDILTSAHQYERHEAVMVINYLVHDAKLLLDEVERLRSYCERINTYRIKLTEQNTTYRHALEEITGVRECDDPTCKCDYFGCVALAKKALEGKE